MKTSTEGTSSLQNDAFTDAGNGGIQMNRKQHIYKDTTRDWFTVFLSFLALLCMGIPGTQAWAFNVNVVDSNGVGVSGFRWLVEEDATYAVTPGVSSPEPLGQNLHQSYMPVVANGASLSSSADIAVPDLQKRYFVTVLPDSGYALGGAQVKPGQADVTVVVNTLPLPTAQISIVVYQDNQPINNAFDTPEESGLEGFTIQLEDAGGRYGISAGQQMTDVFGNPLGTTYDAAGNVLVMGNGVILTDAEGRALIKNLAPGKYGIMAVPPAGQSWVQTATIEGTKVIDAWPKANEPSFFREFGTPGPHVAIGFIQPQNVISAPGGTSISGQVVNNHLARPSDATQQFFFNGGPLGHTTAWIGLNDMATGIGVGVYAERANDDGTFTIPDVPPGPYQLVVWDDNLDQIFAFYDVIVNADGTCNAGVSCDLGEVPVFQWFARLEQMAFYDANENGFRECVTEACDDLVAGDEVGLLEVGSNIRWRDGTVYQSFPTDSTGNAPYDQVFPFFNWLVAEIDFARFKATGATIIVDAGGAIDPNDPWTFDAQLNPQLQPVVDLATGEPLIDPRTGVQATEPLPFRTETGPVLTQAFQGFLGQTSRIEWGKTAYGPGENGGISGIVFYNITRAEDDPELSAAEPWEPGIPRVEVNLYADGDHDHGPMGNFPGAEDVDWNGNGVFDGSDGVIDDINNDGVITRADAIQTTTTDSWDDSKPAGCPGDPTDTFYMDAKCYDGLRNWNQVRPGVFDGGYAFASYIPGGIESGNTEVEGLPEAMYIVESVPPVGYETFKSQDKAVDFGEEYVANPELLPPVCVGEEYVVPDELALFPGVAAPLAGQTLKMCDRKQISLTDGKNAAVDFFMFTEVPIAGHAIGFILDDASNEFDPTAITFGEKYALPFLPISIRDWTGREIHRIYSDQWGNYNALVPSTFTTNIPNPSGMSPNMLTLCMNSPGPIPDPANPGQTIIDPFFNRKYSQFCYTFDFMPGSTTYLDTPVVPVAAFAGPGQDSLDCELENGTPKIYSVSGPDGGPYVPAANGTYSITIVSAGSAVEIPNPAYNPNDPASPVNITRDYGFGNAGTVSIGGTDLIVDAWSPDVIMGRVAAGTTTGELVVTRNDNNKSSLVGVTLSVNEALPPVHVAPGGSIQAAVNGAAPGSLILIPPGTYEESVIMWKPVKLQGWGPGSTTINAVKDPAEALVAWRELLQSLVDPAVGGDASYLLPGQEIGFAGPEPDTLFTEEAAGVLVLARAGEFNENQRARIDGFTITGADFGGAVMVNGRAQYLEISNNNIFGNQGVFGGAIRSGHQTLALDASYVDSGNDFLNIHNNEITRNAGMSDGNAGGGITLATGSDNYSVTDNLICGNFTLGEGAGIAHRGLSSNGLIKDNTIIFNQSFNQGQTVNGGGVLISGLAPLGGAALSDGSGSVQIISNLIQGNLAGAGDGGGIRLSSVNGQDVANAPDNTEAWHSVDILNNIIANNGAGLAGGGISLQDAASVKIIHNTIANNDSTATAGEAFTPGVPTQSNPQPAGVVSRPHSTQLADAIGLGVGLPFMANYSNPILFNNTIWHNRSFYWLLSDTGFGLVPDISAGQAPVYNDLAVVGIAAMLDPMYSILTDVTGYDASNYMFDPLFVSEYVNGDRGWLVLPEVTTGIQAAPALDEGGNFIDVRFGPLTLWNPVSGALFGDYHIVNNSPAIDAGDSVILSSAAALSADVDSEARPSGVAPDVGADEVQATDPQNTCVADINNDGAVDLQDFGILRAQFGTVCSEAAPCSADLNGDNSVDLSDFGILRSEFGRTDCLN
ncbi:MAG: hypothetical protein KQH63_15110 [Desulfobulbaceae bacterium]|nr:hypothetical protein [Desulfobulbaceae bacterium]